MLKGVSSKIRIQLSIMVLKFYKNFIEKKTQINLHYLHIKQHIQIIIALVLYGVIFMIYTYIYLPLPYSQIHLWIF